MDTNAFASLATVQLPSPCRLLASACCPDKDLVVLISRLGGKDRLSLWKIQGSKKWEVDVGSGESSSEEIAGIAWSPDGQSVAVAHSPPRITTHSLQNGREESALLIPQVANVPNRSAKITGIWWFQDENPITDKPAFDIFKRNNIITGSAHSILKILPLLDSLHDDSEKLTATDIFAFQGSQTRSAPKVATPEVITSWPTLHPDLLSASLSPPSQDRSRSSHPDPATDDTDNANLNSMLAVSDDLGYIYFFLDGSYSLGAFLIGPKVSTSTLFKTPDHPMFYIHPQVATEDETATDLQSTTISLPLLNKRDARDLARLSSTARELLWYTTRVVKEIRNAWFGCETHSGARELGPKWVRALEAKQKEQFGQEEPNPILDLTSLLVTGRASVSLHDFLGSSEQISERGIQKWESTVTEALVRLRDFSEKRIAPACQRLHLVLEELHGWSLLPQYAVFDLPAEDVQDCLELAGRAIVISSWLAAVARRELFRFKEFICWLKYEITAANSANENPPPSRHDILEVNSYLMSGLVVSSIDKWFMGPVPQFSSRDIGVLGDKQELSAVLERARNVANDPAQMSWQSEVRQSDVNHLDRNLDVLVQELTIRCHRLFVRASGAATRSAVVRYCPGSVAIQAEGTRPSSSQTNQDLVVRERIMKDKNEAGRHTRYLAAYSSSVDRTLLCLVHTLYDHGTSSQIGVAVLECCLAVETGDGQNEGQKLEVVDADFFDEEYMVAVLRAEDGSGTAFIATVGYNDLGYQEFRPGGYVMGPTREDFIVEVMQQWKQGHLASVRIPIKRCRRLVGRGRGKVNVALNGRVGRRVACLLDDKGTTLECFDLEGDGEDGEGDEDAEAETVGGE